MVPYGPKTLGRAHEGAQRRRSGSLGIAATTSIEDYGGCTRTEKRGQNDSERDNKGALV